ncbi:hypothetical protein [Streptomyces sp. NBC_01497]|uniref:hypothetical protein n=1 Tax=Streptomyces sp. NBC_01497 TaxID=2903885 RepID=UPI002E33EAD0|nr:hypothetical protein [Streptomyces sp. NBC_01497]
MRLSRDIARAWAEAILAQLGAPAGHTLTVTGRGFSAGAGAVASTDADADAGPDAGAGAQDSGPGAGPGGAFASSLRVTPDDGRPSGGDVAGAAPGAAADGDAEGDAEGVLVTLAFADGSSASVHFEEPLPEAEAVTLLADQLQDAVLEETGGAPRPVCPGHGHPAVAEVVDQVACWTCPSGGPRWPVLTAS